MVDLALRQGCTLNEAWTAVGRSFIAQPSNFRENAIRGGLQVGVGFSISARPTMLGPTVVLDFAAAAFVQPISLLDLARETFGHRFDPRRPGGGLNEREWRAFSKAIKGLKVVMTHIAGQKRQRRAFGLSPLAASASMFAWDERGGASTSVLVYFREKYRLTLQFPSLPCVSFSSSKEKPNWVPLEVCGVARGQVKRAASNANIAAELVRYAAVPPEVT